MSENVKKIALVVVILAAGFVCFQGAVRLFGEDKMIVENEIKMPAGHKSEKELALERQRASGAGDPPPYQEKVVGERDLGG